MQAFSVEESIMEGDREVKELFEFIQNHTRQLEAYDMESSIFSKLMKIGLTAMKCHFAEKGTGDRGAELQLEDGVVLKGKVYFGVGTIFQYSASSRFLVLVIAGRGILG